MNHDMTTGPVWKKLLLFMLPVFGANLLQALYGTVDLMVVGINFSMMGYLNGNGKTFFAALQGILSTRGAQNRQRNVWQPLCQKSETSPFLWGRLFALFLCIFPRCCAIVITK